MAAIRDGERPIHSPGRAAGVTPNATDVIPEAPAIALRSVSKEYRRGGRSLFAVDNVTADVQRGEFVAIVGPSGSGKSTLLHLIAGLDAPSGGEVLLSGVPLNTMNERELTRYRRRNVGFVFQFFNLFPNLRAWENVAIPLVLDGLAINKARGPAEALLAQVDLGHRLNHKPGELSGGEAQRVAIARALVASPRLVVADEPTGSLDSQTGLDVIDLLSQRCAEVRSTLLVVTHDEQVASKALRRLVLRDGRLV